MRIFDYIRGLYRVTVGAEGIKPLISAAVARNVPFGKIEKDGEGYSFLVRRRDVAEIQEIAQRAGVEINAVRTGLPALIKKHRLRVGIPVGALLAALMIILSSRFVWDIHISGNERVTDEEIEAALDGYGFRLGAYLPALDIEKICRMIVIENKDISWISVNIRGTVAHVEVRETKSASVEDVSEPSNLVASRDGQIVLVEAYGGKSEVKAGQTVKKGDILVSGVIDSQALGFRLVRSRGKVYAAVTKTFSASVPLSSFEKIYTGNEKVKKTVKFFSKSTELFKNTNISYEKYDTIEKTERVSLFGIRLPIFVTTVTYAEYTEIPRTITEEDAYSAACDTAEREKIIDTKEDRILSQSESKSTENGVCTVTITVECVTDIAAEQKIQTEQR